MKEAQEVTACVWDYGTFESVAAKLAGTYKKVYLYQPHEAEYLDLKQCIQGYGIPDVESVDDPMDPDLIDEIDLHIFPDRGYGPRQRYLRSIGKAVWGSMGVCEYEEYRTRFLDLLKEIGLPIVHSERVKGLSKLADHLKAVEDKWVKINRYRANMETWHHRDYEHSRRMLEYLAMEFGGAQDEIIFVVQDSIPDALEIGYDGWSIDGQYPDKSFQGYEKKNELYLGSWLANNKLPSQVLEVNKALSPMLREAGYRNHIATELRVKNDVGYFIDPTLRMPGQTGEHQLETCTNLPEIIWQGANGNMVQPEFSHRFAAEATMHYTDGEPTEWKVLRLPEDNGAFKLYHYCVIDGLYHFPPARNNEVGVVIGRGDTIEDCLDNLKRNFDMLKKEPVMIHMEEFADLIKEIKRAKQEGIKFTNQKIPKPEIVLKEGDAK